MTKPKFTCFKCGGTDLGVTVLTQAKLLQEPDGNIQTEADGNHEWDASHTMWCNACGACDVAAAFVTPE